MTPNDGEFYLLKQIPAVLRARGFRLYTEGGSIMQRSFPRRLIDLWLNGGAAVLGHTPPNMLCELKNTASRGLYAPLPHFTEARYIKALSKLFPNRCFRLYAAPPPELITLLKNRAAKLWRPFSDSEENGSLLIPVLPGVQTWRDNLPLGLCVVAAKSEDELAKLPPGDILSPVLLAAAARGVHDILGSPQRANPVLPRTFKALPEASLQVQTTAQLWQRQGIYLTQKEKPSPEKWEKLFNKFLEAGFLLPPIPSHPLILPGELSDGEDAKLAAALSLPDQY